MAPVDARPSSLAAIAALLSPLLLGTAHAETYIVDRFDDDPTALSCLVAAWSSAVGTGEE